MDYVKKAGHSCGSRNPGFFTYDFWDRFLGLRLCGAVTSVNKQFQKIHRYLGEVSESRSLRRFYYDLFSKFYDPVIRLHSRDTEGLLRRFITETTNLSKGDRALDLCTGTGSVAAELARQVGEKGMVVGLDFSAGMLRKAKEKSKTLNLDRLFLVLARAHLLPFKNSSFNGVTCSHAFYELKGEERNTAIDETARVLKKGGRFCLMEHAKPQKPLSRIFFYVRIFALGARDASKFLAEEESIFGDNFVNIRKIMSPTGQSKLIYGERRG